MTTSTDATAVQASALEAVTYEIVGLLADKTILPSGHHLAFVSSDVLPDARGRVMFDAYAGDGVTPVTVTVELG